MIIDTFDYLTDNLPLNSLNFSQRVDLIAKNILNYCLDNPKISVLYHGTEDVPGTTIQDGYGEYKLEYCFELICHSKDEEDSISYYLAKYKNILIDSVDLGLFGYEGDYAMIQQKPERNFNGKPYKLTKGKINGNTLKFIKNLKYRMI